MEQVAVLMFQVPGGGGYTLSYNDVMNLDVKWKNYLLEKQDEWFEDYNREMESNT